MKFCRINPEKIYHLDEKSLAKEAIIAYYRIEHPEEQVTYYHNMFCAAIVHPDKKIVIPLAPEPIMKTDGAQKMIANATHQNDCMLMPDANIRI